jgi:hypothetical protein
MNIYHKAFRQGDVRFLLYTEDREDGKSIAKIARDDTNDPLREIVIMQRHPVEIRVDCDSGVCTVSIIRLDEVKISNDDTWHEMWVKPFDKPELL